MTDINDLVQEFWTSSNGAVGTSFFAMRRLLGSLQKGYELVVCFAFFATAVAVELITIYRHPSGPGTIFFTAYAMAARA